MCGIIGYIGSRADEVARYGLKALEYRGYDSAGVFCGGEIVKGVGEVDRILNRIPKGSIISPVIAHTRWATHGGVEDRNAHPHRYGSIVLVHNGTVDIQMDFPALKSDTDTERIAAYIHTQLRTRSMLDVLREMFSDVRGTFSLAIIRIGENDKIYFAKRGTPLVIGIGEEEMFLSSDIIGFLPYTKRYIRLEDGDYGYITQRDYYIYNSGRSVGREVRVFEGSYEIAAKEGYRHFMEKEIHEQVEIVDDIETIDLSEIRDILSNNHIDGIAAGTSYHALLFLRYITKYNITPYLSSEYEYLARDPEYVLAISQSGETIDTIRAAKIGKERGAKIIAITNYLGSTLASIADYVIHMRAGVEIGVAATKTFMAQVLIGYKLADRFNKDEIKRAIKIGLESKLEEIDLDKNIFFVGKGINYPIALEGALKMKEITYLHAEGFAAGEMKHGPLSLFDRNSVTVFIHGNDESYESAMNNYKEIDARGSRIILLDPKRLTDRYFHIAAIVYLQRLAYSTAIRLNRDPDKPRFLAKAVTVE
ncbi:MAG: glutamine--fructose-6-phosphate transaminase (isomerizing) [Candidatus Micrarchaeota archaeon]|nr:glutamine--fructose-6-phosphate transaminase (isomerizing) [Candidatus Micrarchaeota archaeon]MCX8154274.1 glutamine--fructose-6-phosphate transaminase (isomerizing) [Candidatus Micrarchaeota archaeon]